MPEENNMPEFVLPEGLTQSNREVIEELIRQLIEAGSTYQQICEVINIILALMLPGAPQLDCGSPNC